jgi:uncharacterized SAM-binding protein YcdF (DUF218 family)
MSWILGFLVYAIFTKQEKQRKLFLKIATAMLLLFGNNFLINEALSLWEIPATPLSQINQTYDVGIVLTGITNIDQQPRDRVYFTRGADRLMHALQLYKLGKVKHILISGGSGNITGSKESEAEELAEVLLMCGVPGTDITIENKSRNTRENALFSAQVLQEKFKGQSYLLITSAFHMRRAAGCFQKAGVTVTTFTTDFYSAPRKFTPDRLLIPSEGALGKWYLLCHEILGFITYKMIGYAS